MTASTNTFEDRLLAALLDRFDALAHQPPVVPAPIPGRTRVRRYALPVGGLAAAATAAAVILELGGPAPAGHPVLAKPAYALAAWTAQPTSAGPAQIAGAETRCSASVGRPNAPLPVGAQKPAPPPAGGPWRPVLVDTRSDLTLALYSDGPHWMACLAGPSFISTSALDPSGEPPVAASSAGLDKVTIRDVSGDVYTVAVGRAGSGVTAVALQRVDGSVVTATVARGRFIAWWPQAQGIKALSVTTGTGTQSYPVDQRFARSHPQPTNKSSDRSAGAARQRSG